MLPLFKYYPLLKNRLPHAPLGTFPTPLREAVELGRVLGVKQLFFKEDGYSAGPFGGNKIRKLEFVLGEALAQGARQVMTFGMAGSNHALATAVYAKRLGLTCISMLAPQPNAHYVRRNLLLGLSSGARFYYYTSLERMKQRAPYLRFWRRIMGRGAPYLIPPGGSSPPGLMGFVNGALELADQVRQGVMPEPDVIYLPFGTAGTFIGLLTGMRLAGMKSRIVPVRVVDPDFTPPGYAAGLVAQITGLLQRHDPSIESPHVDPAVLEPREGFLGNGYAHFTDEGQASVKLARETENIALDGTYTGKAFAALAADARKGKLKDQTVLFWNTLNAKDISPLIRDVDYHGLPTALHRYFKEDVQPLDFG